MPRVVGGRDHRDPAAPQHAAPLVTQIHESAPPQARAAVYDDVAAAFECYPRAEDLIARAEAYRQGRPMTLPHLFPMTLSDHPFRWSGGREQ